MIIDVKTNVMYRKWEAPAPKAVMLFIHGLGAHTARWEFLAEYLVKKNVTCYAIELKGFGETKELKGHIDSFRSYFDDINSLHATIKNDHPHKKVFLVGESLGALIAFLITASGTSVFDGLICVSPAFKSRLKFSFLEYVQVLLAYFFNPCKQFTVPFNSSMCTRDVEYQKMMDVDEREHRLATARLLVNILVAQIHSQFLKGRLDMSTLFLIAGNDDIVDPATSFKIYKQLKMKDKTVVPFPEMSHALSIDLGREKVFEVIAAWLEERVI